MVSATNSKSPVCKNVQETDPMSKKVLIVDDDKDSARLLEVIVSSLGHQVKKLADGSEVEKTMLEFQPSLVLLDLMMPKIHGYTVLQKVRTNPALSNIKIIIVSAKSYQADKNKAMELGAHGYVTKPFRRADLEAEIKRLLED
jgi:DNA-binding response OmpR family regulator